MSEIPHAIGRGRALAILLSVGLAGLVAGAVMALSGDAELSDAELDALGAEIEKRSPDGPIVLHPPWRDDVAARLRQRLPRRDLRSAPPVQDGLPRAPLALLRVGGAPGPAGYSRLELTDSVSLGSVAIDVYAGASAPSQRLELAAAAPSGRSIVLGDVAALKVRIDLAERSVDCDAYEPAGPRYRCPGLPDWNHVGLRSLIIGGQARDCLWAHPITGGRLVIEAPWPDGAKILRLHYGLADSAANAPGGQAVSLEVLAGEQSLGRFEQPNQPGYSEQSIALEGVTAADHVRFVVTTPHDGARHFCFDARSEAP